MHAVPMHWKIHTVWQCLTRLDRSIFSVLDAMSVHNQKYITKCRAVGIAQSEMKLRHLCFLHVKSCSRVGQLQVGSISQTQLV